MSSTKIRILSIDGGGIRGIIPAKIMMHVESKLQDLSGNKDARIADYFDFVAGTSTGGLLACLYLMPGENGRPKFKAKDGYDFYKQEGYNVFNASRLNFFQRPFGIFGRATRYNPAYLEMLLKNNFADETFDKLLKPCIITAYDIKSQSALFFNSREKASKNRVYQIRDVARSTSAGPTYFPPAKIRNYASMGISEHVNLDGGVFANNPAMCAYAEVRKTKFAKNKNEKPNVSDMMMLSIGTGSKRSVPKRLGRINSWGYATWGKEIPDIMMYGGADTIAYQTNLVFGAPGDQNLTNYKRVDVPPNFEDYNSAMDDASAKNILKLENAAEEALKKSNQPSSAQELSLDDFIKELL